MKKIIFIILSIFISGCAINTYTTNDSDNRLTLTIDDLDISPHFSAEVEVMKIFGIDFESLFNKKTGTYGATTTTSLSNNISSSNKTTFDLKFNENSGLKIISAVGDILSRVLGPSGGSEASTYALYNLLEAHPEYDFILYPRIEENTKGIPMLFSTTKIKVTARLGKIKTRNN